MKLISPNRRGWSGLGALLLALGSFAAILFGLGKMHQAAAAPIQDDMRGHWTDTFVDAVGLDTTTGVVVNGPQERLELDSPIILSQTDWSGGPGLLTTTASSPLGYLDGEAVNPLVTGELSLGFTLAAADELSEFRQDGYPDLVLTNYYSGSLGAGGDYAAESYLYYGGAAGFTETNRAELSILSGQGNAIADLNDDGYLDIVVAHGNPYDSSGPAYIYWGSSDGYSESNRSDLQSDLSTCSAVSDLNQDGHLDIVICNFMDATGDVTIDSYIYWGTGDGTYSTADRTSLPTVGAMSAYAADFDKDGYLDLMFSNYRNSVQSTQLGTFAIDSYLYWGSAAGFSAGNRAELPTVGAHGGSAADLDHDGYLDLVISNRRQGDSTPITTTYEIDSYVYWGSSEGFSETNRLELPTAGSYGNSLADLNGDGYSEIIFGNHFNGVTHALDSYIYWNNGGTFTVTERTGLPTLGATGNCAGDLDLDGYLDIVFANRRLGNDHNVPSYIYWGSGGVYTTTQRGSLATHGALGCSIAGGTVAAANTAYGNVYGTPIGGSTTITDTATAPHIYPTSGVITSTSFDVGSVHVWEAVNWSASIPAGTDIALAVATSNDGTTWSGWSEVASSSNDGANSASLSVADSRFIRYRATLSASDDHRQTPVLYDVEIVGGKTEGSATSISIDPGSIDRWNTVTWTAQVAAGQAVTVQVLDAGGTLVPDGDLPGNSSGFSASPVDISGLDVTSYPSLRLRGWLASDDVTTGPSLDDWSVDWFVAPTTLNLSPASASIAAGETITYTVTASDGHGGSWDVTADSQYAISPDAGGFWTDNIYSSEYAGTWTVTGTYGSLVDTTVLTVSGTNSPPLAADDAYTIYRNTTLSVSAPGVLHNDTDDDGDPLTATLENGPASGILDLQLDGSFTYTPTGSFSGDDSFTYSVSDGSLTNTAAVTIRVTHRMDVDFDCDVDMIDVQATADRWRCALGEDDCYEPTYDVDDSEDINVVDVMLTVDLWDWTCGSD